VTNLTAWLEALVGARGSDLHVKVGSAPRMRVDGRLQNLDGPVITSDMAEGLLSEVIRPDLFDEFQRRNEADFAYSLAGVGRFRVNAFRQRGSVGLVLRRVQEGALSIEDLALPPVIARLAEEPRGLVLVTGPTGSGKTTTLASMIDHVNANRAVHIVTIEDPIEVLHADKLGIVNQREVDLFPPFQQRQVRLSLAAALRGIIGQRLVRRAGDGGRIAVLEVLVNTGRTAEALADPERLGELGTIMTEGGYYGMQTFDQH
jgi:Tfp pilus assembly pilus retraction ATPase PilT